MEEEKIVWYPDVKQLVEDYTSQRGIEGVTDILRLLIHFLLDLKGHSQDDNKTSTN